MKPDFLTNKWIELDSLQANQMVEFCKADHLNRKRLASSGTELPPPDFALVMLSDPIEERQIIMAIGVHVDTRELFSQVDKAMHRKDQSVSVVEFMNRNTVKDAVDVKSTKLN